MTDTSPYRPPHGASTSSAPQVSPKVVAVVRSYGWLLIVTAALVVAGILYTVTLTIPSFFGGFLMYRLLPICIATWVQMDARARRRTPFMDFGFFIYITWMISVPWYLIRTRGCSGALIALMFYAICLLPVFVQAILIELMWFLR